MTILQTFVIVSASTDDYINFSDMGNYDHSVQKNIDKKFSQYGMVAERTVAEGENGEKGLSSPSSHDLACNPVNSDNCVRAMVYMRRIVKSLLRQMNVHSHFFGPGEAITIDLQAELKYDDYVVLMKFADSDHEFDKYLYRIDEIMSNFIHVVEHSASRFDFIDTILNFPAFYSLKFYVILFTSMVIGSLIVLLFVKAFNTRKVINQLIYGFLIIFIISCVWSFSSMYEDKKAEIMTHMVQSNSLPPKDCDYQNWNMAYSAMYWIRTRLFNAKDECGEYYRNTLPDPFWKVNPMEAISQSAAYFFFKPMGYIGGRLGEFYTNFTDPAPFLMKPFMLCIALLLSIIFIFGPFRISTPILTIEPWRQGFPALERNPVHQIHAIGHERIRNEIIERPDGPVIKSVREASTDMDDFQEYLTNQGNDEIEIIGPFATFNSKNTDGIYNCSSRESRDTVSSVEKRLHHRSSNSSNPNHAGCSAKVTCCPDPLEVYPRREIDKRYSKAPDCDVGDGVKVSKNDPAVLFNSPGTDNSVPTPENVLVEDLLSDALKEDNTASFITPCVTEQ